MTNSGEGSVSDVIAGRARWSVTCGDSLALLRSMESNSVDATVTDPPYGTGQWQRASTGAGSDCRAVHSIETWDVWAPAWITEALRVTRGPVLTFVPNGRVEEMLAFGRERDLATRLLLWIKSDPRPRFSGQPAYGFEPVVAFRAVTGGGMDWCAASAPRLNRDHDATGHPHQKPAEVMRWLVEMACPVGGVVLEPHLGSGTTMEAALVTGRRCVGIEQSAEWCAKASLRALAAVGHSAPDALQPSLFAPRPR
jgi:site-specific DNA-methyltransferase (adenine-specific)